MASKSAMNIEVLSNDPRWKGLRPTALRAAEAALKARKIKNAAVVISLSNDAEVKELNHQYRKKNKPTNVLSFTNGDEEEGITQLGDIILAYETVLAESKQQKKPLKHHVTHLVIHGILHLLGWDHEESTAAQQMEAIEIKILKRMSIANPYESD